MAGLDSDNRFHPKQEVPETCLKVEVLDVQIYRALDSRIISTGKENVLNLINNAFERQIEALSLEKTLLKEKLLGEAEENISQKKEFMLGHVWTGTLAGRITENKSFDEPFFAEDRARSESDSFPTIFVNELGERKGTYEISGVNEEDVSTFGTVEEGLDFQTVRAFLPTDGETFDVDFNILVEAINSARELPKINVSASEIADHFMRLPSSGREDIGHTVNEYTLWEVNGLKISLRLPSVGYRFQRLEIEDCGSLLQKKRGKKAQERIIQHKDRWKRNGTVLTLPVRKTAIDETHPDYEAYQTLEKPGIAFIIEPLGNKYDPIIIEYADSLAEKIAGIFTVRA